MGLFLQKTNIVRDYLEDINEEPAPRMFWPRDVWSKYGEKLEVGGLDRRFRSLECIFWPQDVWASNGKNRGAADVFVSPSEWKFKS